MTPEERQTFVQLLLQLLEEVSPDEELVFEVPGAAPSQQVAVSKRQGTRRHGIGGVRVSSVVTAQVQIVMAQDLPPMPPPESGSLSVHPPEPDRGDISKLGKKP